MNRNTKQSEDIISIYNEHTLLSGICIAAPAERHIADAEGIYNAALNIEELVICK